MTPTDESELAEVIRGANGPLAVVGGGTRRIPPDGERVNTTGMAGISRYEPGALTMVAKAGTPLHLIEATLASENQMLAFEPFDLSELTNPGGISTLGGVAATNASGSRRVQTGACRDFMLGVRFVDGEGRVIANGGRVMKNVTGYDLVKLLAGSHGTLGILTEVAFKVLPRPETERTVIVHRLDVTTAVAAMAAALGSPFDVSAAAHGDFGTAIRVSGFEPSVAYRSAQLRELLGQFGEIDIIDTNAIWDNRRTLSGFSASDVLWKVSAKPSDAQGLLADLPPDLVRVLDHGGGRVWIGGPASDAASIHHHLQSSLATCGGHATLMHGPAELRSAVPVFQPPSRVVERLAAGLRAKFDPRGILNPGAMA